jgi:hypothetical protein
MMSSGVDRLHFKSGNDVPVAALPIVSKLSHRIPRLCALDTSLFGHNQLVARDNERFGLRAHST